MKQTLSMILLFATSIMADANTSTRAQYDIKMELSLDGKKVASPKILVAAGNTASVSQEIDGFERFIEVTADDGEINGQKGILMKFVIGSISAEGERTILAKPQILSRDNEKAQVMVDSEGENPQLEFTVIANRKNL